MIIATISLGISAIAMQGTAPAPAAAQRAQVDPGRLMLYNQTNYNGEEMEIDSARRLLHWDYHPRSLVIHPGDRWQICARPRFAECIVLDRSVPDLTMIGIPAGADIGSIRPAPEGAHN